MTAYRYALVWLLGISAVVFVAFAVWGAIQTQRMVEVAREYSAAEAAGLTESLLAQMSPAAIGAVLCLAFAEILALAIKRSNKE
jgi:glucan phosphoethanolaminetransferase (alkaline phosphatase superfamily)